MVMNLTSTLFNSLLVWKFETKQTEEFIVRHGRTTVWTATYIMAYMASTERVLEGGEEKPPPLPSWHLPCLLLIRNSDWQ